MSTNSTVVPSQKTLELNLAPNFFGHTLNWFLLGALTSQTYNYYKKPKRDNVWLKCLVYTIYVLELMQTGLATHLSYETLVSYWGKENILIEVPKTSVALPLFDGVVSAMVQFFFTWRIWILTRSLTQARQYRSVIKAICILVVLLVLLQSISAIVGSALFLHIDNLKQIKRLGMLWEIWLGASVAADVIIAVSMVTILLIARKQSNFHKTRVIIDTLVTRSLETGTLTAVVAASHLFLFIYDESNSLYTIPVFILAKLYSNSFMANLEARNRADTEEDTSMELTSPPKFRSNNSTRKIEIATTTTRTQTIDYGNISQGVTAPNINKVDFREGDDGELASNWKLAVQPLPSHNGVYP